MSRLLLWGCSFAAAFLFACGAVKADGANVDGGPESPAPQVPDAGKTSDADLGADADAGGPTADATGAADSSDAGVDADADVNVPSPCDDVQIACAPGSKDEECQIGTKVLIDTSGATPKLDVSHSAVITTPGHVAKLTFTLDATPVTPATHTATCTLDSASIPCSSGASLGPIADHDDHQLHVSITTLATNTTCVVDMPVVSAPIPEQANALPVWDGSYMLTSAQTFTINQENEHVFVSAPATLDMVGRNYCIQRKSPAACRIVVDAQSFFNVTGSNVNTGADENAKIVLGAGSLTVIRGSNFEPELSVVPGARIYAVGSNLLPKSVAVVAPFTLASCPFSATGACPAGMTTL